MILVSVMTVAVAFASSALLYAVEACHDCAVELQNSGP
jgi:hypothetical protein